MTYMPSSVFARGLSLVELLVSMVVAAVIFGGVVGVVQTSRTTFDTEQESSFIQENARFAIETLSRDIRQAGYMGCVDRSTVQLAYTIDTASFGGLFDSAPVSGYDAGGVGWPTVFSGASAAADSDVIILRYADPEQTAYVDDHTGGTLEFSADHGIESGQPSVIVDLNCRNAGVFRSGTMTDDTMDPDCSQIYTDVSNDDYDTVDTCAEVAAQSVGGDYSQGSQVMPYHAVAYYIADSNIIPGVPALKRRIYSNGAVRTEELAQGVERMLFEYGITVADMLDTVGRFAPASALTPGQWERNVIAVRFELLFRSQNAVLDRPQTYIFDGASVTPTDRFMRQLASSTVRMRNR